MVPIGINRSRLTAVQEVRRGTKVVETVAHVVLVIAVGVLAAVALAQTALDGDVGNTTLPGHYKGQTVDH